MAMQDKFDKIRKQISSKLENQKMYARTLIAIEETIQRQNETLSALAYFGAITTTLQASADRDMAGSLLYLLDEVMPQLEVSVLRAKYSTVQPVLEKVHERYPSDQPIVRSVIGCLQALLMAQDGAVWSTPVTRNTFHQLLVLSANGTAKARKRAQDAVRAILSHPPPPTAVHPAAEITAEFILRVLQEATRANQHSAQMILSLLQSIVLYWPPRHFSTLCETLLKLPKFNNVFLTKAAFDVFDSLFSAIDADIDGDRLAQLLAVLGDLKPAGVDDRLLPTWLEMVRKSYVAFASIRPAQCAENIDTLVAVIFKDLQEQTQSTRQIGTCVAGLIDACIPDDMISRSAAGEATPLTRIIDIVDQGLGIHFQHAWADVMVVHHALFRKLRYHATPLMDRSVSFLGELRLTPSDAYKEQLDKTLGAAIAAMGPESLLRILPLNLENATETGRAFLLPLLKAYTSNTTLAYFTQTLMPLADRLAKKGQELAARELELQAKVYETLAQQIWALAPGFCDLPIDFSSAFNEAVAKRFSEVLYSQPEQRPTIAKALELLVSRHQSLLSSGADDAHLLVAYRLSRADATRHLEHMKQYATNYLAVFFNVFGQIPPAYRGFLAETIQTYLGIVSEQEINGTFKKVITMLTQGLENEESSTREKNIAPDAVAPMTQTMLDLVILMIPYLDTASANLLFQGTVTSLLDLEESPTLQKKAYKILSLLMESKTGKAVVLEQMGPLLGKLIESVKVCTPAAKKNRIQALLLVTRILPPSELHFINVVLPEVILATKENNEKTRTAAFELVIVMGNKMKAGGVIYNSRWNPELPDAEASLSEYFMMVTAGLAGKTAQMVAATITALSRIFFEFREEITSELALELLVTTLSHVCSNNREIVKAALGYIKVCIVTLPTETLALQLQETIAALLSCSHQHRIFKVQLRHLFERLIRRFTFAMVESHFPAEDKKLIANIQKRRLRAKRRKQQGDDGASEEENEEGEEQGERRTESKRVGGAVNAFEEVLYGSDSEIDSASDASDDEEGAETKARPRARKAKASTQNAFIRETADGDPVDFLDRSALGRISSSKPTHKANRSVLKSSGFVEDADGRLVIKEAQKGAADTGADESNEENYYLQAQKNPDGFVRDRRNRIRFKKRGEEDDQMDMDDGDAAPVASRPRAHKSRAERIGGQYRSKKARGDMKVQGKADPYAYVPLQKIIKKKNKNPRQGRVTYTGKTRR